MRRRPTSWLWIAAAALAACLPVDELPVFAEIEELELETSRGEHISESALDDRVHVVDFIFTSCQMACPLMTARMKELHDELAGDDRVRFLSVSTDPEVDTVEVLRAYAREWGADPRRWIFARAPVEEVVRLSEKEFLLAAQDLPLGHSLKFVLVDSKRRIRGYYDSEDASEMARLRRELAGLVGDG